MKVIHSSLLLASLVLANAQDSLRGVQVQQQDNAPAQSRDLIFFDVCAGLVESAIGSPVSCSCTVDLLPPEFGAKCEYDLQLGAVEGAADAIPTVTFTVDPLAFLNGQLGVETEFCFKSIVVSGFSVPDLPLCISFKSGTLSILGFIEIPIIPETMADSSPDYTKCDASFGDSCNRCEPCKDEDGNQGVMFDCTNLQEGLISSSCSTIENFPMKYLELANINKVGMPALDSGEL